MPTHYTAFMTWIDLAIILLALAALWAVHRHTALSDKARLTFNTLVVVIVFLWLLDLLWFSRP